MSFSWERLGKVWFAFCKFMIFPTMVFPTVHFVGSQLDMISPNWNILPRCLLKTWDDYLHRTHLSLVFVSAPPASQPAAAATTTTLLGHHRHEKHLLRKSTALPSFAYTFSIELCESHFQAVQETICSPLLEVGVSSISHFHLIPSIFPKPFNFQTSSPFCEDTEGSHIPGLFGQVLLQDRLATGGRLPRSGAAEPAAELAGRGGMHCGCKGVMGWGSPTVNGHSYQKLTILGCIVTNDEIPQFHDFMISWG